jgi:hypothetical protein
LRRTHHHPVEEGIEINRVALCHCKHPLTQRFFALFISIGVALWVASHDASPYSFKNAVDNLKIKAVENAT